MKSGICFTTERTPGTNSTPLKRQSSTLKMRGYMATKIPPELDLIADVVLNYRHDPKCTTAKPLKKKAKSRPKKRSLQAYDSSRGM